MSFHVRVWGCRGSIPTPGEATVRFGGNTPCVEVRTEDGGLLVLDAGTGLRRLGAQLEWDGPLHILITHLHLDHVEGLRFFAPFWRPGSELHIWGPPSPLHTLEERIARAFSPPLFPIELADTPADVTFHDVPGEPWELEGVRIEAQTVSHPGPTLGYHEFMTLGADVRASTGGMTSTGGMIGKRAPGLPPVQSHIRIQTRAVRSRPPVSTRAAPRRPARRRVRTERASGTAISSPS